MKVFLLLGGNQNEPKKQLHIAQEEIRKNVGHIVAISSIYKTAAWGKENQPDFLNQVLEIETTLDAHSLLKSIASIEIDMGRVRKEKWSQRIIDIDILYYGNEIVKSTDLTIPHPGIPERRFTLIPLVELAPNFKHPTLKKTNAELLEECSDNLFVELT